MGNLLSAVNDMKNKLNQLTGAFKPPEEKGFMGSPPIKFPKAKNAPGVKNLDIRIQQGKIPELSQVVLYECLDELKNDGSFRISGIEVIWTDKMTGLKYTDEKMCGEKQAFRTREIGALDFVKQIQIGKREHNGVSYASYCGLEFHVAEPSGAGFMQAPIEVKEPANTNFAEGAIGFRISVHKKLKVITDIEAMWVRISDKKASTEMVNSITGGGKSFFNDQGSLAFAGKIYEYKNPDTKYEDFSTLITTGKLQEEYLGGLPVRFLSPKEKSRYENLVNQLGLQPLLQVLKAKGNIQGVKLDPAVEDKVVSFVAKVLQDEVFNYSDGRNVNDNIRFAMKMMTIVFTDNETIWKKIQAQVKADYEKKGSTGFDNAIDQLQKDPNLGNVLKIEEKKDEMYDKEGQKACPYNANTADPESEDVEKLAKNYMLDAAQYILEFNSTFSSLFGHKFHGAPVKGLDRIKAKCESYKNDPKKSFTVSQGVAQVKDFLRGTVECKDCKEMTEAFDKINGLSGDFQIVRIKNSFKEQKKDFKSILLNIMAFESLICEVQITLKSFKEGNDLNHFIYEVLREHSLVAVVSKNLNLNVCFNEWLAPLAKDRKVNLPRKQAINWKGYWIQQDDVKNWTDMFKTRKSKRLWFLMNLTIEEDGKIKGGQGDQTGNYILDGKIDFEKGTMEYINKEENPYAGSASYGPLPTGPITNQYQVEYKGHFIDKGMIEGDYTITGEKLKDRGAGGPYGQLITLGQNNGPKKGIFKCWVDDMDCPGLNAGLLAFREITKTSKVIRKKYLPTKAMKWTGKISGYGKKREEKDFTLKMKLGNPKSWLPSQQMTGSGKVGFFGVPRIDGAHSNYDTFMAEIYVRPTRSCLTAPADCNHIILNGFFLEDLKLTGSYDDQGHMGRFTLECQDSDAKKRFGPPGENEKDRWELLTTDNHGVKQYAQISIQPSNDGSVNGAGNNKFGSFDVTGKYDEKAIHFSKTQKNAEGTEETLDFSGQFLSTGFVEGFFRSVSGYGKFKLIRC